MRTAAEVIRRLSQKTDVDSDVRDMSALLVYCFRQIDAGIDESVRAWEKRDYWVKAEQFRLRWEWAGKAAAELHEVIHHEQWEHLPPILIRLLPHFEDIKVARFTRSPSMWRGAYDRLLNENGRSGHTPS